MRFGIRFVLNLSTETGVFESLFHRMISDFERKDSVR
jgi:hypothetical protein